MSMMDLLRRARRLLAQPRVAIRMDEPLAVHRHEPSARGQFAKDGSELGGTEGHGAEEGGGAESGRTGMPHVLLDDLRRAAALQERQVVDEGRRLALEP